MRLTIIGFDYPNVLTLKQVNSGLVMPYVIRSLLGKGATTGLLVLVFMAITSTVSSSMIAVSSIISLDGYRTYINPRASDRKTLQVSHLGVVFHGCFMSLFAIMLEYAGATNNFSTYFRPIIACPGIIPMILTLLWDRQTKLAAILAPILGLSSGLATWVTLSWHWSGGVLNITTLQAQLPGLYGALVSMFGPAIYSVVISLLWPSKFDWREFLRINLIEDESVPNSSLPSKAPSTDAINQVAITEKDSEVSSAKSSEQDSEKTPHLSSKEAPHNAPAIYAPRNVGVPIEQVVHPFDEATLKNVRWWFRTAAIYFVFNVLVTIVLWPIPLYRDYIFSKTFFSGWVTMAILWHFGAIAAVVVYPVYNGRHEIARAVRGMVKHWKERGKTV